MVQLLPGSREIPFPDRLQRRLMLGTREQSSRTRLSPMVLTARVAVAVHVCDVAWRDKDAIR